jgi:hypothetical protein
VIAREEISREMRVEKTGDVVVVVLPGEQLNAGDAEECKRDSALMREANSKVVHYQGSW